MELGDGVREWCQVHGNDHLGLGQSHARRIASRRYLACYLQATLQLVRRASCACAVPSHKCTVNFKLKFINLNLIKTLRLMPMPFLFFLTFTFSFWAPAGEPASIEPCQEDSDPLDAAAMAESPAMAEGSESGV